MFQYIFAGFIKRLVTQLYGFKSSLKFNCFHSICVPGNSCYQSQTQGPILTWNSLPGFDVTLFWIILIFRKSFVQHG